MESIHYNFVDLDNNESFELLGQSLGGVLQNKTLHFDNSIAKGELIKATPEAGLWIHNWNFTVFQKVFFHKIPPPTTDEKKFILIYFLNPAIFSITHKGKNLRVNSLHNNIFLNSNVAVDFSVVPKQPFYVLNVAFSASWIIEQLSDADPAFKAILDKYIYNNAENIFLESCCADEYKILHELETSMLTDNDDILFIRSRVYNLILSFFNKVSNSKEVDLIQKTVSYEQVMHAEKIIMENVTTHLKLETIASKVNMSVSSLLRQFKLVFGKSIYEYHLERKMDFAKKMLLENNISVKGMAAMIGYNQPSAFIDCFTKYHGYSPGRLKLIS
jgi:AraC-like DNA-binding protein